MMRKSFVILFFVISLGLLVYFVRKPDSGVTLSHGSGFYDEPFDLTLSGRGTIYYTLDGSVPDENSLRYTEPIRITDASENPNTISMRTDVTSGFDVETIRKAGGKPPTYKQPVFPIDKCTVIRTVAVDSSGNRSKETVASFFVGFDRKDGYEDMNIISLVTDPANLFDYETGIYVTGKTYDDFLAGYDFLPQCKTLGDPGFLTYSLLEASMTLRKKYSSSWNP